MKIMLTVFICFILFSCNNNDSVISPETDFITNYYTKGYSWDDDSYYFSKNLLNIYLNNNHSITKEIITSQIPDKYRSRKMRVEIGTMTSYLTSYQSKFFYINVDMIYIRSDMSLKAGFAYIFTEKDDNSIYYCRILMI